MRVLGIETSCDETGVAVVEYVDEHSPLKLLSNVINSSMDLHIAFGGVVPEIAARSHIEAIMPAIDQALREAHLPSPDPWDDIDAIAVTYGAGLGGSLLIGVLTARTLAITKHKPLYACNHVEGHLYANFLVDPIPVFPALGLIVSGGHSQLVYFEDHFKYHLLGQTHDDAIGEAFDKVAKMIGLPYPGGPSIGQKALEGNAHAYDFPKAKFDVSRFQARSVVQGDSENRKENVRTRTAARSDNAVIQAAIDSRKYDFSFSGVKTAVLRTAQAITGHDYTFPSYQLPEALSDTQKADIAASFQRIAIETVVDKTVLAFEEFKPKTVIIGGGVAASPELRRQLQERIPLEITYAPPALCTDNGAMIAALGTYKAMHNQAPADPYTLDIAPNLSM